MMAVRRPKVARELIQKWQNEQTEVSMPLNIEVIVKTIHCRLLVGELMVLNVLSLLYCMT